MTTDAELEAEASRLKTKFRNRETIGFLAGLGIFTLVAASSARFFPHIDTWSIVVWFMPIGTLISIFALLSSVSMRASLTERGNPPHPINNLKACITFLLKKEDEEGLRLLSGITIAGSAFLVAFGFAIGLVVYATFFLT